MKTQARSFFQVNSQESSGLGSSGSQRSITRADSAMADAVKIGVTVQRNRIWVVWKSLYFECAIEINVPFGSIEAT